MARARESAGGHAVSLNAKRLDQVKSGAKMEMPVKALRPRRRSFLTMHHPREVIVHNFARWAAASAAAERVVREAPCLVLTIRPTGARAGASRTEPRTRRRKKPV